MQGRLQPAACAHFALIAKPVTDCSIRRAPPADAPFLRSAAGKDRPFRSTDMGTLWALKTISGRSGHGEARQRSIHFFHHSVQIHRIAIESLHAMDGHVIREQPPPLVQARSRGGRGILRIQRQQHDFVALRRLQLLDRLASKRMPVAHGHKAARIDAQRLRIPLSRARACCSVLRRMGEPPPMVA